MKTAWVFPGQGSQVVGMAAHLNPQRLAAASDLLGWSVAEVCENAEQIEQTRYTQPCLYVIESILVDELRQQGQQPDIVAGHSLGEYVSLYTAGVFSFETGLNLVKKRAELMSQPVQGKMTALIGFDRAELLAVIAQTEDVVLANDNSAQQVVISGAPAAVDAVVSQIKKIKKAIPLKVSGAFHSHLMADAASEFAELLLPTTFADAQMPVISNVEPTPTTQAAELKERLGRQMTGAVRWLEICQQLSTLGITQAVEIGPGKVLTGLLKRTCPELKLANISNLSNG